MIPEPAPTRPHHPRESNIHNLFNYGALYAPKILQKSPADTPTQRASTPLPPTAS